LALLHEARSGLVKVLPVDLLLEWMVEDIYGDVGYLTPADAVAAHSELKDITAQLIALVGGRAATANSHELRSRLGLLAEKVSAERESRWLKVNMKRSRLAIMGVLLLTTVLLGVLVLPAVAGKSVVFFLALALAGAAGGLVSSLLTSESLDAKAAEFYVGRRLIYLRPVVGATMSIASYFAVQAGALAVLGVTAASGDGGFVLLGFVSGFSERLFVNKVIDPLTRTSPVANKGALKTQLAFTRRRTSSGRPLPSYPRLQCVLA
jgi:hypothetical protein